MSRRVRREPNIYERVGADGRRRLELGYRDSTGKQRWKRLGEVGIKVARAERDTILGARGKGEHVEPSPRLRFGEAADRWLAEQVSELRPATRSAYGYAIRHTLSRWGRRRLDMIKPDHAAGLVRELRSEGKAEWTIAGALGAANQVFAFARRHMGWRGDNPVVELLKNERPRTGSSPRRRIFRGAELEQTIAATSEPWRTLLWLAAVTGARESELIGLRWEDLALSDPSDATVKIAWQVDRKGKRAPVKTEAGERTIALPRQLVPMLLAHKARSPHKRPGDYVFCSRSGRPLGQRNVLRALRRAQTNARTPEGRPTFPVLHERDETGKPVPVPRNTVPHFHALRHTAASEAIDAGERLEEVSWMLGHRDSTVTSQVYAHELENADRRQRRRALLEGRFGSALEAADLSRSQEAPPGPDGELVRLQEIRAKRAADGNP